MVEPIYVPVLPTTRAAVTAYAHVDPGLRKRIAPLWTILPRTGPERPRGRLMVPDPEPDEAALRHWLTPRVAGLIDVMDGMTGWIDAIHVERLDASAEALWRLATTSSLRLVTGPERTPKQQRYAAGLSFLSGLGLGKAPTRGPYRDYRARAMARWIVESDDFRGTDGLGASEAERWLYACAYGDGARNAATPRNGSRSVISSI
ncbi:hypothetical protein [Streptomyces capitiformicae]|uniref:Uncharacterized protein n=1 Tax=Streptomyces capitiformicae TaxID=2014920 RepID=A0A918YZQ3_9ACTN|nr:hypothetical protein [Streptomyces capitiformicae]GHE29595.1 hypothetical protein GCM10017771_45510 [Streptomyces capitiformicae]